MAKEISNISLFNLITCVIYYLILSILYQSILINDTCSKKNELFKSKSPYLFWNPFVQCINPFQPILRVSGSLPWPHVFILPPGRVIQTMVDGGEGGRELVSIEVWSSGSGSAFIDLGRFAVEIIPMRRMEGPCGVMTWTWARSGRIMTLIQNKNQTHHSMIFFCKSQSTKKKN